MTAIFCDSLACWGWERGPRACGRVAPSKLQEWPPPATGGALYAQARRERNEELHRWQ